MAAKNIMMSLPQTMQRLEITRSIHGLEAGSTWEKRSPIENVYHASLVAVNASASEVVHKCGHQSSFLILWSDLLKVCKDLGYKSWNG